MDRITKSPGLYHILEEIFANLHYPSILYCVNVNSVWREVLNSQTFWLKRPELPNFLTFLRQEIPKGHEINHIPDHIRLELEKSFFDSLMKHLDSLPPVQIEQPRLHHFYNVCEEMPKTFGYELDTEHFSEIRGLLST